MPDIRGLKRVCASCATRFYDFNKSPIICPKCSAEFTGIVKVRTRRGRNVIEEAKAKAALEAEDAVDVVEGDDETVSLEDLEGESDDLEGDDAEALELDEEDLDDDLEDIEEDIEIEEEKE